MLSKTLKANAKKIKWALSSLVLLGIAASIIVWFAPETKHVDKPLPCLNVSSSQACDYALEVADTARTRIKGLSNRDSLPPKTGMLFVFDRPSEQCFWMKDMRFPIDMIWLNERQVITKIESDVQPSTYPNQFCAQETKYVVELNTGEAKHSNLAVGQQLSVVQ